LTAYDLITFHHRGANYPDALLLHAVLQENIRLIDAHPELFCNATDTDGRRQWQRRRRRRGLRQGWVMWHLSQGLPIPDMPTSPGENVRILPPPFIRVPDEQILTPSKRTKRLFAGQCLPLPTDQNEKIFQECIADLRHSEELQELGMALFLDRPLGVFKAPGEPDHTVLLSHEAFSRSIAERRLQFLAEHIPFLLRQNDHDF